MKKIYFLALLFFLFASSAFSQMICSPTGNIIIYSNYDGGPITINVDQNIPNLKIGIVSYEFARITITGTYAGNVTEVRWAGYNGSNDHCNLGAPLYTTITGVANNVDTIITIPAANYSNVNGYGYIICNYSCSSTTNQGGCNTPDQIVAYFLSAFGAADNTSLYYHHTQYGCWSGTYDVSAGGNCCIGPITTSIAKDDASQKLFVSPNPSSGIFHVELPFGTAAGDLKIFNVMGEEISATKISSSSDINLQGQAEGVYFLQFTNGKESFTKRIVLAE